MEKVVRNNYDLVLMDIQMPEMDGMEATEMIRHLKDANKAATPIVALTANVLNGDGERYLSRGMNDMLSKLLVHFNIINHQHFSIAQTFIIGF